jgi:hypothetical protein
MSGHHILLLGSPAKILTQIQEGCKLGQGMITRREDAFSRRKYGWEGLFSLTFRAALIKMDRLKVLAFNKGELL